ncbi:MAG: alanine racemase [Immundisolibacterales bacterium]|nr:alanine racemase [Immundisolibacterales bacterium]
MESVRPNRAEFDLGALRHNARELRRLAGPEAKIIAALKANAYGHGAAPVARTLADDGDTFALATGSFEDALAIRSAGVELPIMMFAGALPEAAPLVLAHDLMPTVYDLPGAEAASAAGAAAGRTAPVYVKVDAGLGRLGVPLPDALEYIRALQRLPNLRVEGVYTHLSFYDEMEREWARSHLRGFDALLEALEAAGIEVPVTQALASSCMVAGLASRGNAVCPGHFLYGVPSIAPSVADTSAFRPVLRSIKSRIIHAGPPKAGMRGLPERDTPSRIGVIPLGLADGYRPAAAGRSPCALVDGARVPIRGVSLEHITLDLSARPAAGVGDEVVLLGESGGESITLADLADWQGTRLHHVLMALDGRLPAHYDDGDPP